jgi:hypothetical protein
MKQHSRGDTHHTQLHLPPLAGGDALLVVNILERIVEAIWRAHGEAMAEALCEHYESEQRKTEAPEERCRCEEPGLF